MMVKLILSLMTLLAIAFFSTVSSNVVEASPYGVGKYGAAVPYGGATQLTISTSGDIAFPVTASDAATLASTSGTVTVVSTDVVGYKLYIRGITSTNMTNPVGGITIPASANGSPASLATNTWGYNLTGLTTFTGMTLSDVLVKTTTQPFYPAGDVTTVTYGVRVDNSKKAGAYATSVLYTAVPQTY